MEEVICRINPANSALFAGLIRQIVPYLPDYFPANSALFAGLIRQIVSYLPDYFPANSALFARLILQIVSFLRDYENLRSCKGTYGPVRYWSDTSRHYLPD